MAVHGRVRESAENGLEDLDQVALNYAEQRDSARHAIRESLREELIRHCLPFAARLARRYRGRGEAVEDLEQVARLGLVKAVDRYDPERGSFTAYAMITISGEIKRHFRDRTWGVHVPRRVQDLSLEVNHASMVLTSALARKPTVAELAERLNVTEAAVRDAMASAAGYSPASLNVPIAGDGAMEFGDLLGDVDSDLELLTDRLTVTDLLLRLPVRERRMLAMRFYGNRTQAEIAAELGISQMHVSRLLSRALTWLREAMLSDTPPRWDGADIRQGAPGMHVSVARAGSVLTVRVRGEVDRDTADRLSVTLGHAAGLAGITGITVDLAGVPLVDAAGVRVLLDAATRATAAGVEFVVTGAQQYVARVLAVSGLAAALRRT